MRQTEAYIKLSDELQTVQHKKDQSKKKVPLKEAPEIKALQSQIDTLTKFTQLIEKKQSLQDEKV